MVGLNSYAVKFTHPFFESAVIGVDVLDVVDASDNPFSRRHIDRTMGDMFLFGNCLIHERAIGTKHSQCGRISLPLCGIIMHFQCVC